MANQIRDILSVAITFGDRESPHTITTSRSSAPGMMATSKEVEAKQSSLQHEDRDDLSDAASSRAEEQTLAGDDLPSYEEAQPDASSKDYPKEKNANGKPIGPTASAPFNFPDSELPKYTTAASTINKPLAIPQVSPRSTAPLLAAYPTNLINYGIPPDSWYSFLNTTSAFLSANVSKQALHHAADVGHAMGDFQKQYANNVKKSVKAMGKSAKSFNPFGVFGGFVGLTVGAASHVVGSVVSAPLSAIKKPQTPRQRALAYLDTANLDWFHSRGLHALLCDSRELSLELNISVEDLLHRASQSEKSSEQMNALSEWIGEVHVDERDEEFSLNSAGPSSKASKQPSRTQLQVGQDTLWLVLVHNAQVKGGDKAPGAY
ncbi:hypothetical protein AC578_9530 [Pseudocercospora eumusae]|uniref:Uncharacterized protein n=1 Tax=Pseudocercospora eumusae TaxID=321146 RepID=A0A139HGE9_9PEZI|nr:hypothetical protein AC578_9530 [Pseudocercospora eumusae]